MRPGEGHASRHQTGFTTQNKQFQFMHMLVFFKKRAIPFLRSIEGLLPKRKGDCLCLHDFDLFAQSSERHINHVRKALTILKDRSVMQRLKICLSFVQDALKYPLEPSKKFCKIQAPTIRINLQTLSRFLQQFRPQVLNSARPSSPVTTNSKIVTDYFVSFTVQEWQHLRRCKQVSFRPTVVSPPTCMGRISWTVTSKTSRLVEFYSKVKQLEATNQLPIASL